ncbi:MAG: aminotransferase class III-fold pyridoxal phosphate-dependent enzyme [Anaerolineaceae bacterium]|nr:aminotransferase class III-fold pyridoxal phosphate-dependent enzyme [Anaerolineaceae bacterium]
MVSMQENIRPVFSIAEAKKVLLAHYNLDAEKIIELSAELDRNFFVMATNGQAYVLKVAHTSLSDAVLDLQNATLKHLASVSDIFPKLILTIEGNDGQSVHSSSDQTYIVRLLRYLDGTPLVDFRPHTSELLSDIGYQLGQLSDAMQSFQHIEKRFDYRWNILNFMDIVAYMAGMPDEKQAIVRHFVSLFQHDVVPKLSSLRHSFIYNDANDHNILVQAHSLETYRVSGMIDFGDMVYSPTIMELAVALAYAMMNKEQPLDAAARLIDGYNRIFPLTEDEISVLLALIGARLCMSVCISWYQQQHEPDNPHLSVSEDAAWKLLHRLYNIQPNFAHYVFRDACGLTPYPKTQIWADWVSSQAFHAILHQPITAENSVVLDLSIGSTDLGNVDDFADVVTMARQLSTLMGGKIGIGRYNEARPIYLNESFAISHHERRTIHTGIDLFVPPGTPFFAPLNGRIHHVQNNANELDYGPTLILEHQPTPELTFYTLYGHLDVSVLDKWHPGDIVEAGQELGHIGAYPSNGNWPPHIHFQIILDMLNNDGDFPGVVSPHHRSVWLSLSPNPNLILSIPQDVAAPEASNHQDILDTRQAHLNPSMSISYQEPLKIVRGYMHHLYDENGQPYLDCVNNVPQVGHSNPRVVKAGQRQMAVLNTNTRYLHDTIAQFAQRLCATLPDRLSVCFFVNSGSEANELAIRLAEAYTGGTGFVVTDHAYHGHTTSLIHISPYKFNGRGGAGKADHVEVATIPDGYRGEVQGFDEKVGRYYAQSVAAAIKRLQAGGRRVAGFFSEGILGTGGQITLPDAYLQTAYEMVHAAGGVCIADEVQLGFGRVGQHFWAFELQGIVPDIVTMGKPIGNGHPMAAVVTTREIADAFHNGMEYFNTFGGNPVSCAIGLEVLNIIEDENLQQNASEVGTYWMDRFKVLQATYPIIGHVRGSGLFIGVELIRDTDTLEAADVETTYIVERMKQKGFLLSTEGYLHNVLKVKPPIIFTKAHVDIFMAAFEDVLQDTVLRHIARS